MSAAEREHGVDETRARVYATPEMIAHAVMALTSFEPPHEDCELCRRLAERFALPQQP